jgi:serine/threonine-protein kinase HipA
MNRIEVLLEDELAGWVTHDPMANRFAFKYSAGWLGRRHRYPLSPNIPLDPIEGQSAELHSTIVRQFFDNLMPEGRALDEAAAANKISKANLVGLMLALGRETAGALRLRLEPQEQSHAATVEDTEAQAPNEPRRIPPEEMSKRIRARPYEPFSVWDGKVRLSIAGYQDKIAVFKEETVWFLVEGDRLASTVILKPEPVNESLAGLTSNEFFCMRLARNVGLSVAPVKLVHVPEPVLEVERFDREKRAERVRRLHIFDGCQALGLSAGFKYERPYGDNPDVRAIRDGASLPQIFEFLGKTQKPAAQRLQMLRWVIFQVLIGNTDAHAKNISFFSDQGGYWLTPTYDLVSTLAFNNKKLEDSFAMAVGDAFLESELNPYEWAHFGASCKLRPRLVSLEMKKLVDRILGQLELTVEETRNEGADTDVVHRVCEVIHRVCERHQAIAPELIKVEPDLF